MFLSRFRTMRPLRLLLVPGLAGAVLLSGCDERRPPSVKKRDIDETVHLLMQEDARLTDISFAKLVEAATGHRVLPWDSNDAVCQYVSERIAAAATNVRRSLNRSDHPSRTTKRINEVSTFAENEFRSLLDADPLLKCRIPENSSGMERRSGYPDLIITHTPSNQIVYLDPKLYSIEQVTSSFRSFYYQPSVTTNKIHHDAYHLVIGISHDTVEGDRQFLNWTLVDLSKMAISLKAEFHSSNKEMYHSDHVIVSE